MLLELTAELLICAETMRELFYLEIWTESHLSSKRETEVALIFFDFRTKIKLKSLWQIKRCLEARRVFRKLNKIGLN